MLSQACVKNSVHGGGSYPSMHWAGVVCIAECTGGIYLLGVLAQRGCTPPSSRPEADTPSPGTANATDGTHPSGMHSCFNN